MIAEQVLDVVNQQLLMLHFVLEPEPDYLPNLAGIITRRNSFDESRHLLIDVRAIGSCLRDRRTRARAALWPLNARAETLVVGGEHEQRRGRIQADERLGRHLGQPDLPPAGQPMVARQGEAERLDRDQPGACRIVRRSPRAELEVRVPAVQDDEVRFVARLGKPEPDARMRGTEAAGQVGDEPGAQRLLKGQRHGAGVRVDELADGGDAVVEIVQQRVQVRLEHRPGVRHPQRPARAAQQRRADLLLEPGQGARDPGLGGRLQLADLGHRGAVGHLLEPAQRIGVHTHDSNSCFSC